MQPSPSETRINVTDMTKKQRRQLFRNYMNREGFIGFVKDQQGNQTQYVFYYLCSESEGARY